MKKLKESLQFLFIKLDIDIVELDYRDDNNKDKIDVFFLFILFVLQLMDFLSTWYGINIAYTITEKNPLMVWLFEINFLPAILIRLLIQYCIIKLFEYLKILDHKYFRVVLGIGIILNIAINLKHLMITF